LLLPLSFSLSFSRLGAIRMNEKRQIRQRHWLLLLQNKVDCFELSLLAGL
jgi:hypothetical protein